MAFEIFISSAPKSASNISARSNAFASGFSNQGKPATSSIPLAFKVSTTSARSSRFTSGNSCAARCACSRSVHKRTQRPGAVRPARPARWSALAREIFSTSSVLMPRLGSNFACRARPASTTMVTPSMVSEVSATLVETMILRAAVRATALSCASGGSSPCSGSTTQPLSARCSASACNVRPISYAPGKNTKKSPSVCPATRAHSRAATSHTGSFSKLTALGRYSIATGKLRPCEVRISQGAR